MSSFGPNQENARSLKQGPKMEISVHIQLYSRLSNFDLAINYLVTILFQEVRFDIWLLVDLQIYHL